MKILVTGAAGFIGFHLANRLLNDGHEVVGLDSINDYYQVGLKYDRLAAAGISQRNIGYNRPVQSEMHSEYRFVKLQLEDESKLFKLFAKERFDYVVHLAAQAGVRYSIENPGAYINSNIAGFANLLEAVRHFPVKHLVYAGSSSIYGLNQKVPYSTADSATHPVSLYGATKKSNELIAHAYSHLFQIPMTGLRFFTVYGPWGRPDMAYFLFTEAILQNKPIKVFNDGKMSRDFTFVGDIVEGIVKVMEKPAVPSPDWNPKAPNPAISSAPYRIYNIGNRNPANLLDFIKTIEKALGKTAEKKFMPLQPGDMVKTYADVENLVADFGYKPETSLEKGIGAFVEWYLKYYNC